MSAEKPWNVAYRFAVQDDLPVSSVRYAQVGIQRRKHFTGYIHDYTGGGSYTRWWFLDGHEFESEYYCHEERYIRPAARREIDKKYPGLIIGIDEVLKQHIYWRDTVPYARPYTRIEASKIPPDYMLAKGILTPIAAGNTSFETDGETREPLMVLEDLSVCTLAEFHKIQAAEEALHQLEAEDDEYWPSATKTIAKIKINPRSKR